jgi:hypothetical protein
MREVIVFDQLDRKLATLHYDTEGLDGMRFVSQTTLALCTSAAIPLIDLTVTEYTSFNTKESYHEIN